MAFFELPEGPEPNEPASGTASGAEASLTSGCYGGGDGRDGTAPAPSCSFLGQSISAVVDRMLLTTHSSGGDNGDAGGARAEFCIAWPPTFPVGGPAEVVELRAAVSVDAGAACTCRSAAMAAAVAECCSRVLAVRDDVVVGEEGIKVDGGGRARVRLRLQSDHPGVTTCILASCQGVPSLESFQDAAPLMGLPQAARDEAHRLLWRMMHEALQPNHSTLLFDPDAFRSPVDILPPKLQAALSWAWLHHFRAFAHDFSYLLDCLPAGGGGGGGGGPDGGWLFHPQQLSYAGGATGDEEDQDDNVSHYQSVMAQMVVFLRDNEMFACLATLLQTAVASGLALVADGVCLVASPHWLAEVEAQETADPAAAAAGGDGGAASAALTSALAALHAAAAAARDAAIIDGGGSVGSPIGTGATPSPCGSPRRPAVVTIGFADAVLPDVMTVAATLQQFGDSEQPGANVPIGAAALLTCAAAASAPSAVPSNPAASLLVLLLGLIWALAAPQLPGGGIAASGVFVVLIVLFIIAVAMLAATRAAAAALRGGSKCVGGGGDGPAVAASGGSSSGSSFLGRLSGAVHMSAAAWYATAAPAAAVAAAPAEGVAVAAAAAAIMILLPLATATAAAMMASCVGAAALSAPLPCRRRCPVGAAALSAPLPCRRRCPVGLQYDRYEVQGGRNRGYSLSPQ